MSRVLLEAKGISKKYEKFSKSLEVLKSIDLTIHSGEKVAITGESGAGKSTFLHILGTLDSPTSGEIFFEDSKVSVSQWSEAELAKFRNRNLGFIFQFHHLLPEFTALENVLMPCKIGRVPEKIAFEKAKTLLDYVGLSDRLDHLPQELSGGEQQRVAVARALVMQPKLLLADEPTGNLDTANSQKIAELLLKSARDFGVSILLVTHDRALAALMNRNLELADGAWTV